MITEMMLIFTVFTGSISNVYPVPEVRAHPTVKETLAECVNDVPYDIGSYELHGMDCTEMCAIMECHLTGCGYDTKIVTFKGRGVTGHVMVRMYADNPYLVECTAKKIVAHPLVGYIETDEYEDIVDTVENSGWGASDWGLEMYLNEREKE